MNPKYLYTIKWSQPYATNQMRPYLRQLRDDYDKVIEAQLEKQEFAQANEVLKRIMKL
jgi:hypothetical protein